MAVEIGEQLLLGEESFDVLYTFTMNNLNYLVVGLSEELEEEREDISITAFRYTEEEDGTLVFDEIESDEEWNEIEAKFIAYQEELEKEVH
ncbi:DUF1292 domain-containing protein [Bacillus sp. 2205SS5-2]|uniref:DUF1292 domain-containing protein n=1 Tax=Bacillus sp. 2205SS5-2 TaxID=3109031 RepID=UPI00300535B1